MGIFFLSRITLRSILTRLYCTSVLCQYLSLAWRFIRFIVWSVHYCNFASNFFCSWILFFQLWWKLCSFNLIIINCWPGKTLKRRIQTGKQTNWLFSPLEVFIFIACFGEKMFLFKNDFLFYQMRLLQHEHIGKTLWRVDAFYRNSNPYLEDVRSKWFVINI